MTDNVNHPVHRAAGGIECVAALAYIQLLEGHIGELAKMVPRWISVKEQKPEEFVSVQGYMPMEAPLPVVRECYRVTSEDNHELYYFPALTDFREITHWMEMP